MGLEPPGRDSLLLTMSGNAVVDTVVEICGSKDQNHRLKEFN